MILNYLENEPQQARLNTNSVASACKAKHVTTVKRGKLKKTGNNKEGK